MILKVKVLITILIASFLLISDPVYASDFKLKMGDLAPAYLGRDRDGEEVNLENMRGKVTVVSFWATWCPPCLKELPVLENIQGQVGKDKLEVVAVNFKEPRKHFNKIKKKLANLKLTLTHDRKGRISKKYGVTALPHVLIIDKQGKIIYQNLGYGEKGVMELVAKLNELLAG